MAATGLVWSSSEIDDRSWIMQEGIKMSWLVFGALVVIIWMLSDILNHIAEQNKKNQK